MTKSWEKGWHEFTEAAKRQGMRTGESFEQVLAQWLEAAKKAKDAGKRKKLVQALKYAAARNRKKRRDQS